MSRRFSHSPTRLPRSARRRREQVKILLVEQLETRRLLTTFASPGFSETLITTNDDLSRPTAMEFSPTGQLWVLEQGGNAKVVDFSTGGTSIAGTLTVQSNNERGLLGIAFEQSYDGAGPNADNVYLYYTATTPNIHNRLSRFVVNNAGSNTPTLGAETIIMEIAPEPQGDGSANHNGGAIHFGLDGNLYVAIGDHNADGSSFHGSSHVSQSLNFQHGKILRIDVSGDDFPADPNRNYAIPTDNPFLDSDPATFDETWVLGLRNPYTFAVQPETGRIFINDVGERQWEEINDGVAGANYGWATEQTPGGFAEGFESAAPAYTTVGTYANPIMAFDHSNSSPSPFGCAITGGVFYPSGSQFGSAYDGRYFFADFCGNFIRVLDPANPGTLGTPDTSTDFASNLTTGAPVDLKVDASGNLYYLARGGPGEIYRISSTTVSIAGATDGDEAGPVNGVFTVSQNLATSDDTVLTYSVGGSATSGSDYAPLSGTVTILAGATSATINVPVIDDLLVEGTETVSITLTTITSSSPGVMISTGNDIDSIDILDDDSGPLPPNVAHLELEDNLSDSVGNHHGQPSGNPTFVTGQIGQGLQLDGNNDQLDIPSSALAQITDDLTAALWIYPDAFGGFKTVFDTPGRELSLWINTPTSGWYGMGGINGSINFSQPFTLNEWQHVTFVKAGSQASLYRNAVQVATVAASSIDAETWSIGGSSSGDSPKFDGQIDDIRLYDRALSQEEINELAGAASLPTVTIEATTPLAMEEGMVPGELLVSRGSTTAGDLMIHYTVSGTSSNNDYVEVLTGSVTIDNGESVVAISITPIDDPGFEPDESVTLTLSGNGVYVVGSSASATVTILDNDSAPTSPEVAHLQLENNTDDSVGNHHGQLVGNPTYISGQIGQGMDLDGNGDQLDIPSTALAEITDNLTAAMWINPGAFGGFKTVFNTPGRELSLWINTPTSGWYGMGGVNGAISFSQPFTLNEWQHVAFVKDGNQAHLYRNAVQIATVAAASIDAETWSIGGSVSGGSFFAGQIDDIRLYNRTLSQQEINELVGIISPPTVTIQASSPTAFEEGMVPGQLLVSRGSASAGDLTIHYTVGGTAADSDFVETLNGSVTIVDGRSDVTIPITPVDDQDAEPTESVTVTLSSDNDYLIGSPNSAMVNILDNDSGTPPPDVAHLQLENNANDLVGNHHGQLMGNPTFVPGQIGQALDLDGSSDQLDIPASALGQISDNLTAALWIYPDAFGGFKTIFDTPGRELSLWINTPSSGWYGMGGINGSINFSQPFTLNDWQHVTFVKDGSQARLYRNAVQIATTIASSIDAEPWSIGGSVSGGSPNLDGLVDDIRLYDRALTQQEINQLVNSQLPLAANIDQGDGTSTSALPFALTDGGHAEATAIDEWDAVNTFGLRHSLDSSSVNATVVDNHAADDESYFDRRLDERSTSSFKRSRRTVSAADVASGSIELLTSRLHKLDLVLKMEDDFSQVHPDHLPGIALQSVVGRLPTEVELAAILADPTAFTRQLGL